MQEFKTISFVVFDHAGKPHKVAMDKVEGETPNYTLRGDPKMLLDRWNMVSKMIEYYLRGQVK